MVEPASTAAVPTSPKRTPVTHTTRRGLATASFSLGFWGTAVFWWYPFGMALCVVGLALGLVSLALGIRAGKDGENIGLLGVIFCSIGLGLSLAVYRFVQYAFEGSLTGSLYDG
ncbi:MAG TPA: hypothetical protein VM533_03510 [Fimbriiglobus sp.]|jgi:hypothetical protein|nr:hypothetical protein [Fimbriiglobus sp.]